MEFTTKKILNKAKLILPTISGFFIAFICLIVQYFNANISTNVRPNSHREFSSKFESSVTSATITTMTNTPSIQVTAAAAATTTTTTTTNTPSIFSSLFDSTPYSSPWMYSTSADLIGIESGVFMASTHEEEEEILQQYHTRKSNCHNIRKKQPKKYMKKEYPPTIPSWRGKLPGDLPWSLSRHYVDGRLILKEKGLEYYEYLESKQKNGRLVLNLLVLENNMKCSFDDTIEAEITHDDTIDRVEEKTMIQEEIQRDFMTINGDIGTKREENISNIGNFANEEGMASNSSLLVAA
ncbi:uncharacterized protein LOC132599504 [Lycium barbarum]|uniref:uncharacterized protein LOC132599504 n=1 Tax=Lycium barbarum TaxID=112863 RepID=UPI00293EB29E|nr:uncharacterized protein LOC132599504 [Lycium barbarum]